MLNATQWWRQWTGAERPWLILENGETIARLDEFDISPYATLAMPGIDHHLKVDAAFVTAEKITDETLLKSLAAQTHFLLVPESLGTASLTEAVRKSDTLTSLDHHLRLISYPQDAFQGAPPDLTDTAQALWLLAWLGARNIRTLGVDYGFAPTPEANSKARLHRGGHTKVWPLQRPAHLRGARAHLHRHRLHPGYRRENTRIHRPQARHADHRVRQHVQRASSHAARPRQPAAHRVFLQPLRHPEARRLPWTRDVRGRRHDGIRRPARALGDAFRRRHRDVRSTVAPLPLEADQRHANGLQPRHLGS